jgi:hypothetical protein
LRTIGVLAFLVGEETHKPSKKETQHNLSILLLFIAFTVRRRVHIQ